MVTTNLLIWLANKLPLIYSINLSIQTWDPNMDFMQHEAAIGFVLCK